MSADKTNNLAQLDLEAVVREVLRRLTVDAPRKSANQTSVSQPAATQPSAPAGALTISSKVVSVEQLRGRLDGVKHVVVSRGAVITPAARDLLKDKRIAIASAAETKQKKCGQHRLAIGLAETSFEPAGLIRAISQRGAAVERVANSGLISVVDEVSEQVGKSGMLGLVLTSKSAAAAALANRQRGVRAAVAGDARQVASAVVSLGANLLVIDTAGRGTFELQKMVQEFIKGGPRHCPAELAGRL